MVCLGHSVLHKHHVAPRWVHDSLCMLWGPDFLLKWLFSNNIMMDTALFILMAYHPEAQTETENFPWFGKTFHSHGASPKSFWSTLAFPTTMTPRMNLRENCRFMRWTKTVPESGEGTMSLSDPFAPTSTILAIWSRGLWIGQANFQMPRYNGRLVVQLWFDSGNLGCWHDTRWAVEKAQDNQIWLGWNSYAVF